MKINEVLNIMDKWAPFDSAYDWDNVGLLVGDADDDVKGILIALDVTLNVIAEAKKLGANLIVTHHPVIFDSMNEVTTNSSQGKIVTSLIKAGISVISAHTNLDIADGGVTAALAEKLELVNIRAAEGLPLFKIGDMPYEMSSDELAKYVAKKLDSKRIICAGSAPGTIKTVCVLGGAGGGDILDAKSIGADAYITGSAKHSNAIEADTLGVFMICAGHYETEIAVLPKILEYLQKHADDVQSIGAINISMNGNNPFDIKV